jgi:hypothetical protein
MSVRAAAVALTGAAVLAVVPAAGAKRTTSADTFRILRTSSPQYVLNNGAHGTIAIWWTGRASFPVTVHDAPASCPSGFTCHAQTDLVGAQANPLRWAAWWCSGSDRAWTLDFWFWLTDASGAATQRVRARVACLLHAPVAKPPATKRRKPKRPSHVGGSGSSGGSSGGGKSAYATGIYGGKTDDGGDVNFEVHRVGGRLFLTDFHLNSNTGGEGKSHYDCYTADGTDALQSGGWGTGNDVPTRIPVVGGAFHLRFEHVEPLSFKAAAELDGHFSAPKAIEGRISLADVQPLANYVKCTLGEPAMAWSAKLEVPSPS